MTNTDLQQLDAQVAEQVMEPMTHIDNGEGWCANCEMEMPDYQKMRQKQYGTTKPIITRCLGKSYSTDIAAAFQVVERMRELGWKVEIYGTDSNGGWYVTLEYYDNPLSRTGAGGSELPDCICRVALEAIGEK